ncbi:MFS transporter [Pseudonocardia lutea]|uniref:MFS transporter n=1 Tax=Pseudonocardia lutea TaxID=2172015 RepID=A0ABW1ICW2_9PSEU
MSEQSPSTTGRAPDAGEPAVGGGTVTANAVPERPLAYWIGVLLVLVLLSEEVAYAFNLVTPALPGMAEAFQTTQIGWVSTAFSLAGAITAPLVGKLADMYGKKRWLLIAAGTMVVGSAIVALAPSFAFVVVGRTIEGVGLAIVPITYSLMRDIFPKRMLAMAVSISVAGIGLTGIVGPIIAGVLIDNFGYRGVFWALALFPLAIGILVFLVVPESPVRVRSRIDWAGAGLLGLALAVLLLGVGEGATWGWTDWKTLGCFVVAVLVFMAWVGYERRPEFPLVDLTLVRSRAVVTTMLASFTSQGVIALQFVLLSFVVQVPRELGGTYGFGESASAMAAYTSPAGVISMAMGFVVGWLAERRGARLPLWVGFALAAAGSLVLAFAHDTPTQVVIGYFVYAVGGGLISAAVPNLVIAAVPVEQQAVSASTINVVGSLGSTIAVQVGFAILLTTVVTVVQGTPIYGGAGITAVYVLAAVLSVVGLVAGLLMRHGRRPQSAEAVSTV